MQCLKFKVVLLYSSTYSSIPLSPPDDKMSPLGNTPVQKNGHDDKNYHLTFPICWLPQLGCTEKTMGWEFPVFWERALICKVLKLTLTSVLSCSSVTGAYNWLLPFFWQWTWIFYVCFSYDVPTCATRARGRIYGLTPLPPTSLSY